MQAISLGQGQGPIAENLIKTAMTNGDWVFLQVNQYISVCFSIFITMGYFGISSQF